MNKNLADNQLNKILLKPRFKIERSEGTAVIIEKYKNEFGQSGSEFFGKIVDHHIIIDVPNEVAHFWSPQLHIEVVEDEKGHTLIKGLYGPKPSVWSLFMFIHFAVAVSFIVFLVITYTRWSLNQDYTTSMVMCIAMPVLWLILYFLGRIGRKKGAQQMIEINTFFTKILDS